MLGKKMAKSKVNVWLINTGWSGGVYGEGTRIKLKYTRAMISAALKGMLDDIRYKNHPIFGLHMPESCPDVPTELLDPKNTWENKNAYDAKANQLATAFRVNFEPFNSDANEKILEGAPRVIVEN